MAAQAAEFAQVCKAAALHLDYLPRTLPLVDEFLNAYALGVPTAAMRRPSPPTWAR